MISAMEAVGEVTRFAGVRFDKKLRKGKEIISVMGKAVYRNISCWKLEYK